jgi:hypothetical protein
LLILGIVLIALTIVGTVLGSVLMMSQISMASKGQSLEQLKTKNINARDNAQNLDDMVLVEEVASNLNNSKNSSNCGVPSDYEGTHIVCTIEASDNPNASRVKIQFTDKKGAKVNRSFVVPSNQSNESDNNAD